ncbi:hypothetical protein PCANC_20502 [Puccinia coronata f. sp. avenae]|uniref:Cation/H+ exchanger transmembrane domain-containing protein n=1 Tax=Puccinia coronata f. sp. avenae TaxID=200324 RepID=A0A2N5UQB8_9BASI|nr:hypothetical protein PCANC_20502 [Puccinia coronata f. sp. avenae]PLW39958.1 hypothetical protein PCASD_06819 [Puccinia coronata f. sp. avenae]
MRLSIRHSDRQVMIFLCLCMNTFLSHPSPTGSIFEERTLASRGFNPEDNPSANLVTRRNALTPLHAPRSLPSQQHAPQLNARAKGDKDIALANGLKTGTGAGLASANKKMNKISTQVNDVYLAIALIPAFIICYGSISSFLKEKLYLGEAMLAVMFGIVLGPYVTDLFDPRSWSNGASFNEVTLEVTRIIVALDVFSAGVELPPAYLLRHWRTMTVLLIPVVLAGWFISGGLIFALVSSLSYLEALVIAACVCPTDILLASSVLGKGRYAQKHVPSHLQHMLHAEAGANDGMGMILLYLALFLVIRDQDSVGVAIGRWFLLGLLYHVVLGIIMGAVIGIIARKMLKFSKRRMLIDKESTMVALYIALALLTAGVAILAGTDDIVASFACGVAFAWDGYFSEAIEVTNFSAILSHLVNNTVFIYVGATIPFELWNNSVVMFTAWKMVLLALSILLLRRLPVVLFLRKLIPDLKTNREALFCGHFGPIGVSGLFIAILATEKLPTPQIPPRTSLDVLALTIQPIMYLLLCFSVFIHGLSVPFFSLGKNFGSRVNSLRRSGTFTGSVRSGRANSLSRFDSINMTQTGITLHDEPQSLTAIPPPSPTPTINSRAHYHHSKSVSQSTQVEVEEDFEVGMDKESHKKQEKRPLLEDEEKTGRDWIDSHPVDNPDGSRMYKCGKHLIIERDDGKELEVWRLQPASVEKVPDPPQFTRPSDPLTSCDLKGTGDPSVLPIDTSVPIISSGHSQPAAGLSSNGNRRMDHGKEEKMCSEGNLNQRKGISGSAVDAQVKVAPFPTRSVDDRESGCSEWVDEDHETVKTRRVKGLRPQPKYLALRPRRYTPRSRQGASRGRTESRGVERVGRECVGVSSQQKPRSARSPSRSLSPSSRSGSSFGSPRNRKPFPALRHVEGSTRAVREQKPVPHGLLKRYSQFPNDAHGDARENRKSRSSGEYSRAPSPSCSDEAERPPIRRRGTDSRGNNSRRVSFADASER